MWTMESFFECLFNLDSQTVFCVRYTLHYLGECWMNWFCIRFSLSSVQPCAGKKRSVVTSVRPYPSQETNKTSHNKANNDERRLSPAWLFIFDLFIMNLH